MSTAQVSVGIIILSLSMGFLFYYFLNDLTREKKKGSMEEVLGQLMNFVIYMWIGKIILNLSVFLRDPLSIVAYPSNSSAFYVAVLASGITISLKFKRQKIDSTPFFQALLSILLMASFVYEFIQIVWNNNTYSIRYMGLLAVLIIMIVVLRDRIATDRLNAIMIVGWMLGTLGLAFSMPFTMVFGYTISPWFLSLMFITSLTMLMIKKWRTVL